MLGLYQPPVGFHFVVSVGDLLGGPPLKAVAFDSSFQEVSGLSATIQMETIQSGGTNDVVYKVPKGVEYSNLVLKRGLVTLSSDLQKWCLDSAVKNDFQLEQKNIVIRLLNNYHVPLMTWTVKKAIPVKYEASGFDAMTGKIMVESLEFCYQSFEMENNPVLAAMQTASMAAASLQAAADLVTGTIEKAVNSTASQVKSAVDDVTGFHVDKPDIDLGF
jgi:phage tail-like protein